MPRQNTMPEKCTDREYGTRVFVYLYIACLCSQLRNSTIEKGDSEGDDNFKHCPPYLFVREVTF